MIKILFTTPLANIQYHPNRTHENHQTCAAGADERQRQPGGWNRACYDLLLH